MPVCYTCVTIYSKAAMLLSNLFHADGNIPPVSDIRLPHGCASGYKISRYIQILRTLLLTLYGNAAHLTIPVSTSPQKLSIGALSQQFPLRLMLLMNPCAFASA